MKINHSQNGSVGTSPVESVLLVKKYFRRKISFEANSLPGHLIHFVIRGSVEQECNGRRYLLKPGSVVWYHEDELVKGRVLEAPWEFYSVNFIAPTLPPPAFESRLLNPHRRIESEFKALYENWHSASHHLLVRQLRVQSSLLKILAALLDSGGSLGFQMEPAAKLWWFLETEFRKDLKQQFNLENMSKLTGRSRATIARSCQLAVGLPPLKRIKQLRLSLGKGLVKHSKLQITEIADRIGYDRIHDFSRDYRKWFGKSPSSDRS